MFPQTIESAFNAQIEKEGYSSHLYLAMASWAEATGYPGIAEWLYAQSEEERLHMLKITRFVNERGGTAKIGPLQGPPAKFSSVKSLFEEVLKHEEFITQSINEIVLLCGKEKDVTSQTFLQWFVNEQMEEEKNAHAILDKLKLAGENSLYLFDRDIMSMRAAKAPEAAGP